MKVKKREIAFEGRYLRLERITVVSADKKEFIWESVERTNVYGRGAVVIVAQTQREEIILERHWRAPIESFVIQFPGGLTDEQYESDEDVAKRELLEETGYIAEKLIPVIHVPVNPVLTSMTVSYYFAPGVKFIGNIKKDITEEIEVLTIPTNSLEQFLISLPADTKLDLRVPGVLWILRVKGLI